MMPPKRHTQEENVDSWLMSYADMITLLLGFFIIFVSVSEPKKEKLSAIHEGISGQFGSVQLATPFQGVYRSLVGIVEEQNVLHEVAIERTDKSLEVELSTLAFFEDKSAELNADRRPLLEKIVKEVTSLNYLDTTITLEGHTNDVAVFSDQFHNNWELSAARAAALAQFFQEQGVTAKRLKAVGYADTQPKVPNLDLQSKPIEANRLQNERVVIRIEKDY